MKEKLKTLLEQATKVSNWVSAILGALLSLLVSGCSVFGTGVGSTSTIL